MPVRTLLRPPWLSRYGDASRQYLEGLVTAEEFDAWHEAVMGLDAEASRPVKRTGAKPSGSLVPCLLCTQPYTRKQVNGHYCKPCQKEVRKRRNALNMRKVREELREALPRVVSEPGPGVFQKLDKAAEQEARDTRGLLPDRMPAGSQTPYGSDDGRSTYEKDLSEDLDRLSWYAACHRWWLDNPHWNVGLYSG